MIHDCKLYNKKLLSKEEVILRSLYEFYGEDNNIDKILPIITGKTNISLRVMDWFVTNYAKKYDITYKICKNNENITFNVHHDYKNKLKSYNKRFLILSVEKIKKFNKQDCI